MLDPDSSLSPTSAGSNHVSESVPTVNGYAKIAFHSGTISGTVRIKAMIVDISGNVILPEVSSETTEIQVFSGPPYLNTTDLMIRLLNPG